ncbi:hypothetical protein T459_00901 [Capsicum annuum]|uniref:Uncharacterized protein n=1 Tax=Capsicum annuum TaxID=4072 RepID=A0A2G3AFK9_CAPAN|nr:hypothetical protein T459_00901 [Capsicum annuum]
MELHAFVKQFSYRTERSSARRPIIVVDGAALKAVYGGTILTASTLDPGDLLKPPCLLVTFLVALLSLIAPVMTRTEALTLMDIPNHEGPSAPSNLQS